MVATKVNAQLQIVHHDSILNIRVEPRPAIFTGDLFPLDKMTDSMAENLNRLGKSDDLPSFVSDHCIDTLSLHFFSSRTPISVRKSIIDKVVNIEVLRRISNLSLAAQDCEARQTAQKLTLCL